jgi:hypothetical protein
VAPKEISQMNCFHVKNKLGGNATTFWPIYFTNKITLATPFNTITCNRVTRKDETPPPKLFVPAPCFQSFGGALDGAHVQSAGNEDRNEIGCCRTSLWLPMVVNIGADFLDRTKPESIRWILEVPAKACEGLEVRCLRSTHTHLMSDKNHPAAGLGRVIDQLLHLVEIKIVNWSSHGFGKVDEGGIIRGLVKVPAAR